MLTDMMEDTNIEDDDLASMTIEDIKRQSHLLDNEIRVWNLIRLVEELQRTNLELDSFKDKIKENPEKIKLNKQLPYLVGNIVENRLPRSIATLEWENSFVSVYSKGRDEAINFGTPKPVTQSSRSLDLVQDPIHSQLVGPTQQAFQIQFKPEGTMLDPHRSYMHVAAIQAAKAISSASQRFSLSTKTTTSSPQYSCHEARLEAGGCFKSRKEENPPDMETPGRKSQAKFQKRRKLPHPTKIQNPTSKRNENKFCEFHGEVGHNKDECNHLKKQIKDMLKAGKLSHLIKELKQNSGKDLQKKKGEPHRKEKPPTILMIQPWQKAVRQKITQNFLPDLEISFPSLGDDEGAEGSLIIEEKIGGHQVHRMCVDGGSSF
ncbi:hypothetical protein Tco_1408156 [Tanacetum coccineum]